MVWERRPVVTEKYTRREFGSGSQVNEGRSGDRMWSVRGE